MLDKLLEHNFKRARFKKCVNKHVTLKIFKKDSRVGLCMKTKEEKNRKKKPKIQGGLV